MTASRAYTDDLRRRLHPPDHPYEQARTDCDVENALPLVPPKVPPSGTTSIPRAERPTHDAPTVSPVPLRRQIRCSFP